MFFALLPLFIAIVGANPTYIGTPLTLEHTYPGVNLHHLSQASALIGQPLSSLYQFGNFDQLSTLTKGLLSSHIGGEKAKGLSLPIIPSALGLASPEIHHFPIGLPIKKEMGIPEKTIAGALIKQVPKVSKLPISVALSPKALELSSIAQAGILSGGLTGASLLPLKSSIGGSIGGSLGGSIGSSIGGSLGGSLGGSIGGLGIPYGF